MDRCVILNDNNKLYNREIGLPAFLNRIKYIRGGWQVKPNRVGSVDLGTVDPSAAQRSRKYLRARTVPTLRSKTMPSLSPNFTGQDACQVEKIFWWGLLSPGGSQSVRGQENIITTGTVTMQNHYTKTLIPASELGCALVGIDSRT